MRPPLYDVCVIMGSEYTGIQYVGMYGLGSVNRVVEQARSTTDN